MPNRRVIICSRESTQLAAMCSALFGAIQLRKKQGGGRRLGWLSRIRQLGYASAFCCVPATEKPDYL